MNKKRLKNKNIPSIFELPRRYLDGPARVYYNIPHGRLMHIARVQVVDIL